MADTAKTTVYLGRADYRRLQAMAREQERSAAELIREAVADYTRKHDIRPKPRSLGVGHSGRDDVGSRAEELLAGMGERR